MRDTGSWESLHTARSSRLCQVLWGGEKHEWTGRFLELIWHPNHTGPGATLVPDRRVTTDWRRNRCTTRYHLDSISSLGIADHRCGISFPDDPQPGILRARPSISWYRSAASLNGTLTLLV